MQKISMNVEPTNDPFLSAIDKIRKQQDEKAEIEVKK